MTDEQIIEWAADRMVEVYGESPNVDFVLRLRQAARTARWVRGLAEEWEGDSHPLARRLVILLDEHPGLRV